MKLWSTIRQMSLDWEKTVTVIIRNAETTSHVSKAFKYIPTTV